MLALEVDPQDATAQAGLINSCAKLTRRCLKPTQGEPGDAAASPELLLRQPKSLEQSAVSPFQSLFGRLGQCRLSLQPSRQARPPAQKQDVCLVLLDDTECGEQLTQFRLTWPRSAAASLNSNRDLITVIRDAGPLSTSSFAFSPHPTINATTASTPTWTSPDC